MRVWVFLFASLVSLATTAAPIVIGSKKFTESVILAEVARLTFAQNRTPVQHRPEFGGTRILWNALKSADIDVYPEYTGTIEAELLQKKASDFGELRRLLAAEGIGVSSALGFNNTYALGMRRQQAQALGIRTISDLRRHKDLKIGLSSEFRQRKDGWPGLRQAYKLGHQNIRGLDHDVAYRALEQGDIEVVDLYSTDAEIPYYDLVTLTDDENYFPSYEAVYLYRLSMAEQVASVLEQLAGKVTVTEMVAMNKEAKIDKLPSNQIAAGFLERVLFDKVTVRRGSRSARLLSTSLEHLKLVSISMVLAILFAIPLGVVVAKHRHLGRGILVVVSAIQTIPALALLVLMIKPLGMLGLPGIGDTPAMIALFLYSLLPIVRNTLSGIEQVPTGLRETAEVLNLSERTKLWKIELPLALPSILAGIKTALVLNVGFATLGALVGAGGYGQPILTGIRLDDYGLILEGAIPATVLALVCQWGFDFLETKIVSPGLR